jgi:hypothetical protein
MLANSNKLWLVATVALLGLCVGAALDEAIHAVLNRKSESRDRENNELFQQRLRCRNEVDAYMRSTSDDGNGPPMLEVVEFSPLRHSCVAEFTRILHGKRAEIWTYETVDILTGESLFSDLCLIGGDPSNSCDNGRDMQLKAERDKALKDVLLKQ